MFSNAEATATFAAAANSLKRILMRGRADRRVENKPLLDGPR
jgi:hypothetical protein